MNSKISILALTALLFQAASAFAPATHHHHATTSSGIASISRPQTTTVALQMASEEDLLRWARSSRNAGADDNLVELKRPIGVVLAEDDKGNVFVETLAPKGNAARSGKVSLRICRVVMLEIEVSNLILLTLFYFSYLGQGRRYSDHVLGNLWR